MRKLIVAVVVVLLASACGGGDSLSSDEETWCRDNPDIVIDAADDLGLIDFVFAYYDTEGDGLGTDGRPVQSERNREVSEELSARNSDDPDGLFDDLFSGYLDHPDGQQACSAAYAEEA